MRVLLTETVDPEGAMHRWMSPDLETLGHQVVVVPAQETVHHLGCSGWQQLLCEVAASFQPDLILTHPPYDHLSLDVSQTLRQGGARLVGFAFDDAIFLRRWRQADLVDDVVRGFDALYDLYLTTSLEFTEVASALGARQVRWTRWALSVPCPREPPSEIPARAVLIGRAYARRVALVSALAQAGLTIRVRGHGWPEAAAELEGQGLTLDVGGYLEADAMRDALREGVVISTGDWEGEDVGMLKLRVLETAAAGACQVAAACPELGAHFEADEVASYSDLETLIETLGALFASSTHRVAMAAAAQKRVLREHTWKTRFQDLLETLEEVGRPPLDRPASQFQCAAYALSLQGLGASAEFAQRFGAAEGFFRLADSAGAGTSAALGRARCLLQLRRNEEAAIALAGLLEPLRESVQPAQRSLRTRVVSRAHGTGLGNNRLLAPDIEAVAYLLVAYTRSGQLIKARELLDTLLGADGDYVVLVASLLVPEEGADELWRALFEAALAANPGGLEEVQQQHAARWQAWLGKDG